MLTDTFLQLVNKYSDNNELSTNLWLEIFTKYSEPKRHYHTIAHLETIIMELKEVKDKITDWEIYLNKFRDFMVMVLAIREFLML